MDTVFSLTGADSAGIWSTGLHRTGRSTMTLRAVDMDSASWGTWKTQDTGMLRQNEEGIWAGDALLAATATRDSVDVVWRWWMRTNGLGAPDAAMADHAWLQEALARWRAPLPWGVHAGVLGGGLVERQDPGAITLGLDPARSPGKGSETALWGTEAGWAGGTSIPSSLQAMTLEDQGDGRLRLSRRSVEMALAASLSGDGSDSLHLYGGWDSLRLRTERFLSDRTEGLRQAGGSWVLPAGGQVWTFDGSWVSSGRRDLTGRSQGQDLTGTYGDADLSGDLGSGWSHHHRLARSMEDRTWFSEDTSLAAEDRKDRDRTGILQLSDTLRWTTDRAGGWTALTGIVQSLRQVRHPWNPSPSPTDRPDEDLSRRMLTFSVFSPMLGWGEHPLATWNILVQEDVFPCGVQSIQTTRRVENRFSMDLDPAFLDAARFLSKDSSDHWIRPLGGIWGREQRNRWRFDTSRTEGLLEEGWSAGLELGPKSQPWITARWMRWRVWTGTLPGADFAPDQIQDDWAPELTGTIPMRDSLVLRPWARMQVERIQAWNGTGWENEIRNRNIRTGMDLSWSWKSGSVRLSAGREWNDPGWDGWTGGFSAQVFL